MIDLYEYSSYIAYIDATIAENIGERGYQRRLAEAAGCAPPYLSSARRGKCVLTPDHAFGLCRFWHFDPAHESFFMLLLQHARASTKAYRQALELRIKAARQAQRKLAKRTGAQQLGESEALAYYRHWSMAAVHVITSIPALQTPADIASALRLSLATVQACLDRLVELGLVARHGKRYERTAKNLHVAAESPINVMNHTNWRSKIIADGAFGLPETFNYSAVFAVSRADFEQIRSELYGFFDRLQAIVAGSPEETMGAICLDLVPLLER